MSVNDLIALLITIQQDPQAASALVTMGGGKEISGVAVLRELDNKNNDRVKVTLQTPPSRTSSYSSAASRIRNRNRY